MSNFFADLMNRTAMLGRVQGDLRNSQAGELNMAMMYNRAEREAREAKSAMREAQSKLELAYREMWEWKAKGDSCRILARQYGEALGKSEAERIRDRQEITVSLAEKDPGIAKTRFAIESREALAKAKEPGDQPDTRT